MSHINFDQLDNITSSSPARQLQLHLASMPEPDLADDVQSLLRAQSEKLALSNTLNELIRKRAYLKESIQEMSDELEKLKSLTQKADVTSKLQQMLQQNTQEYTDTSVSKSATPDLTTAHLIRNLNVLPSNDWDDRLVLVRKFYPYLDVERIETSSGFDQNHLIRTISYTILCPLLFRLPLSVAIDGKTDSVSRIDCSVLKLATLRLISPSFTQVLTSNYINLNKIDLVMYSLNSLSVAVHHRVSVLYKVIRMYADFVEDARLAELTGDSEISNNVRLFALMKSINSVPLVVENQNEVYDVVLHWEIVLSNTVTGTCGHDVSLSIYRRSDSSQLKAESLFRGLVEEYGPLNGFRTLLRTTFNVHVD